MVFLGQSEIQPDQLGEFLKSQRALTMLAVMSVLVFLHPLISFVKRPLGVDVGSSRARVIEIMEEYNYAIISENDDEIIFNEKAAWRRVLSPYDEAIVISKKSLPTMIEGNRKAVVRITLRIKP